MKTLWLLTTLILAALLLAPLSPCEGMRRGGRSSLRRRPFSTAASSFSRPNHSRRSLPPPPPPRCYSDVTRPEVVDEYETKVKEAPFVFTGKVIQIEEQGRSLSSIQVDGNGADWDDRPKMFEVRLKRGLKGDFPWSLLDVELSNPHHHKTVEVLVNSRSDSDGGQETTTASQHNRHRQPRCRHVLRQNHTAIFLARREDDDGVGVGEPFRLQLVSNPLALTLRNLDKINAAVRDISYKPRAPVIEEPCEKQFCSFGANCVTDSEGRARCQCPIDCPDVIAHVCGTDGQTYGNHCLLRKKSCQDETNIRVQHSGECGAESYSSQRG